MGFVENIGTIQAILFIVGLILLIVEMFTPGFGIAGGTGIALLIAGIIMTARTALEAFVMVLILFLLVALLVFAVLRSAKKGKLSKKLILRSSLRREAGFSATQDATALIGTVGTAISPLRPAGIGEFEGKRLDVISEGLYMEPGAKIEIVQAQGRRIVVKAVE